MLLEGSTVLMPGWMQVVDVMWVFWGRDLTDRPLPVSNVLADASLTGDDPTRTAREMMAGRRHGERRPRLTRHRRQQSGSLDIRQRFMDRANCALPLRAQGA